MEIIIKEKESKKKIKTVDEINGQASVSSKVINGNGLMKIFGGEIKKIRKRNGEEVAFNINKIVNVVFRAMLSTGEGKEKDAVSVAKKVYLDLLKKVSRKKDFVPNVEEVQDLVEKHLILTDFVQTAKTFILYRSKREELRDVRAEVSREVRDLAKESSKYFSGVLGEFVYYRTYSRWRGDLGRREYWTETVNRFMDYMFERLGKGLSQKKYTEVRNAILNQEVIPSMRLLWAAGDAARASNVAAYNCSFISINNLQDFAEIMYISMCGCGVGFSVEERSIGRLPIIEPQTGKKVKGHVVADSKIGWADAFAKGLKTWFGGKDIEFDYSKVRPQGSRLKTMGGRASGPKPLAELIDFTRERIIAHQGKRLSSLDVHDIVCKIGEIVVAGGVRRSAMISISDLDDLEMRDAKQGQFWIRNSQRSMSNNSVSYNEKPTSAEFIKEWLALAQSGTGERGIFNRGSLVKQLP